MQTLFDALGGLPALRRLAHAWHLRVMADEVVSHAFSHGFHPDHTQRPAAYCVRWAATAVMTRVNRLFNAAVTSPPDCTS